MTEPKRDEAQEIADELVRISMDYNGQCPSKAEILALVRPHLAPRAVESAIVDAWWHVVQQDAYTIIEWFGVPGGRLYSMRRPRDAFEQVVFVPEQSQ